MTQPRDYGDRPRQGGAYPPAQAAGWQPEGNGGPRRQQPATPPQWQQGAQPGYQPPQDDPWAASGQQYPQQQSLPPVFTPGYDGRPQQPRGYYPPPRQAWQQPAPRKKRRVFLWVFLAIQVLFIVLIIVQVAAHPAGPTAAQQAAQTCAHGGWYPLFKSQADCQTHYAVALNDAGNVGKGLGVVAIVIGWMVTDFFVGLGYGIYRLASRR